MSEQINLVFGNIRSNPVMPEAQVQADLHTMRHSRKTQNADIYCGYEIIPKNYKQLWRDTFGRRDGYRTYGLKTTENPVSIDTDFTHRGGHLWLRVPGIAHFSPNRFDVVERELTRTGFKLAVVSTHMVNEAFTHKDITDRAKRLRLWNKHHEATMRTVASLRRRGWTVIVCGDLNAPHTVHFGPGQIDVSNKGLMQCAILPAPGVKVTIDNVAEVGTDEVYTDHPLTAVHFTLAA